MKAGDTVFYPKRWDDPEGPAHKALLVSTDPVHSTIELYQNNKLIRVLVKTASLYVKPNQPPTHNPRARNR